VIEQLRRYLTGKGIIISDISDRHWGQTLGRIAGGRSLD